jgi:D-arabinose 1-dehydrogenase-like Zn-dependent alcohol dehydrogenase
MKGEIPFSSPCVVGHEITGEVVDHGTHTPAEIISRYVYMKPHFICFTKICYWLG